MLNEPHTSEVMCGGQLLLPFPLLMPPTSWSWIKTAEGVCEPHWTTLPEASKVYYELISCKCKKGCRGLSKWKKVAYIMYCLVHVWRGMYSKLNLLYM